MENEHAAADDIATAGVQLMAAVYSGKLIVQVHIILQTAILWVCIKMSIFIKDGVWSAT